MVFKSIYKVFTYFIYKGKTEKLMLYTQWYSPKVVIADLQTGVIESQKEVENVKQINDLIVWNNFPNKRQIIAGTTNKNALMLLGFNDLKAAKIIDTNFEYIPYDPLTILKILKKDKTSNEWKECLISCESSRIKLFE